jgi:succinate dehydrogenase / fumarate reductase membrane anchor subunit
VVSHLGASRADIVLVFKNPFVSVAMVLALVSITWHMRLGLQVVIEDYVHTEGRKLLALTLNMFFVYALTAIGVYAILKMGFGL